MKKLIINHKALKYRVLLILVFLSMSVWSQCPTILNSSQIFCDSDLANVGSLAAQNNGGGVVWYNSPNSIIPLGNFEPLINGNTYYAGDNSGSCLNRPSVTVTILTAPSGPNFQGFCVPSLEEATVANLIAIGTGIQWFSTPFGGKPLSTTDILTSC
jgi:hypothetical protein